MARATQPLALLLLLVVAAPSVWGQSLPQGMAQPKASVYQARIVGRPMAPFVRNGPIRMVGSRAVTGVATLTVTGSAIGTSMAAQGSFPGQGSVRAQVFNPLAGTKAATVALWHTPDGGKTWEHLTELKGTWSNVGGQMQFAGTTNPGPAMSKYSFTSNPKSFAVVVSFAPGPRLSDFVYCSSGVLKKVA